jgi:hypothetical protein
MTLCVVSAQAQDSPAADAPPQPDKNVPVVQAPAQQPAPVERPEAQAPVHYRINATAWMIGPDQVAWVGMRDRTCGGVVDPLGCRIRVTREHVHVLTGRPGPRPRPVEHR